MTQLGHSESVTRGQPKVGFDFCHDFNNGLSDHLGVNDGLGLYLLTTWIESKMAPATAASPRSAYLIGFITQLLPEEFTQYRIKRSQPLCLSATGDFSDQFTDCLIARACHLASDSAIRVILNLEDVGTTLRIARIWFPLFSTPFSSPPVRQIKRLIALT